MYIYNYSTDTHEYTDRSEASLDPMATKREGKDVWLVPANATLLKPPKLTKFKTAVFENDTWVIKDDYRGEYICNEALDVFVMQEIGAIPEGSIRITQKQAEQIAKDPLWYIVQDGELIKNPDYDKQKEEQRKEQIRRLAMTKYDFFKFVCQPNDITYSQLCQLVQSNDEVAAAWDLCGHVYRGDNVLCKYIKEFFPEMTDEKLDEIFEQHGKVINE